MAEYLQGPSSVAVRLVPYAEDPLQTLAALLLDSGSGPAHDLSHAVVLFPHSSAVPRFRRVLLDVASARRIDALISPRTTTLTAWLRTFANATQRQLGDAGRELLLLDAMAQHPELARRWGTWPLIESLLALFDELSLNQVQLPPDCTSFTRLLASGYGVPEPAPSALGDEAQLAHTLWNAWRQQLATDGSQDATGATVAGLIQSLKQLPAHTHVYLAGFVQFDPLVLVWLHSLQARRQATVLLHGQSGASGNHPDAVITQILHSLRATAPSSTRPCYGRFIDNVFDLDAGDMPARAHSQRQATPESPARGRLIIHEADNFEREARAIDVQVRRWRLQGLCHVGIVTNDRKLARRVRALLERADIFVEDSAGWALSTTSAATALMRWLECLEQDFAHAALLDLLKSPFVSLGLPRPRLAETVLWLEQGVILQHNIARGLKRYQHTLDRNAHALDQRYQDGAANAVGELLERLAVAARPLTAIIDTRPRSAATFLAALTQSLDALGALTQYGDDDAGSALVRELQEMHVTLPTHSPRVSWAEFRRWLGRNLERTYFQPPIRNAEVTLMGFSGSRLLRFDAVVIAGALRDHLPGPIQSTPFFNESVRHQLGLPSLWVTHRARFHDFRRLLEAAPRVLITLRHEHQGETAIPSPWVERLRAFHQIAYGDSLDDDELRHLAASALTQITWSEDTGLPIPQSYPVATLPPALVPDSLSASTHQRMLDCPYQFYAADGLALTPVEPVREQLEKVDYGTRVHRILQAFHAGVPGLPGPFEEKLTPESRSQAEAMLREIGQAVFAADIRNSFFARGWLLAWEKLIPPYVDWELRRAKQWRALAAEHKQQRTCSDKGVTVMLKSRVDRLDHGEPGYAIIDYKTGRVPELADIESGEQIQLPFYVLTTAQQVSQALFVGLTGTRISDRTGLSGSRLDTLTQRVRERLLRVQHAMLSGTGLPAWGDDTVCARCSMHGLCRKEMWLDPTGSAHPSPPA